MYLEGQIIIFDEPESPGTLSFVHRKNDFGSAISRRDASLGSECCVDRSSTRPGLENPAMIAMLIVTQNGVGAFILQCKRLDFHYSDWAGSSRGIKYVLVAPLAVPYL